MVLWVSLLPKTSDPEEFFHDPFANIKAGEAWPFLIHHVHTIVYHQHPNMEAFQDLFLLVPPCYLSLLTKGLIDKGNAFLQAQRTAQCTSQEAVAPSQEPPPVTPPPSLLDRYVAASFVGAPVGMENSPSTLFATRGSGALSTVAAPIGPPWGLLCSPSHHPDPNGFDNPTLEPYLGCCLAYRGLLLAMGRVGGFLAVPVLTLMGGNLSLLMGGSMGGLLLALVRSHIVSTIIRLNRSILGWLLM